MDVKRKRGRPRKEIINSIIDKPELIMDKPELIVDKPEISVNKEIFVTDLNGIEYNYNDYHKKHCSEIKLNCSFPYTEFKSFFRKLNFDISELTDEIKDIDNKLIGLINQNGDLMNDINQLRRSDSKLEPNYKSVSWLV